MNGLMIQKCPGNLFIRYSTTLIQYSSPVWESVTGITHDYFSFWYFPVTFAGKSPIPRVKANIQWESTETLVTTVHKFTWITHYSTDKPYRLQTTARVVRQVLCYQCPHIASVAALDVHKLLFLFFVFVATRYQITLRSLPLPNDRLYTLRTINPTLGSWRMDVFGVLQEKDSISYLLTLNIFERF